MTSDDAKQSERFLSIPETAPVAGMTYWVRCEGFRTRAVYTSSGKWLLPHNGEEIKGVLGFFS